MLVIKVVFPYSWGCEFLHVGTFKELPTCLE